MNYYNLSDQALLETLGKLLQQQRLRQDMSQEQLPSRAGVDRTTISYLENGRAASIITLVQVLRALQLLDVLEQLELTNEISPLELLKQKGKTRKRASGKNTSGNEHPSEW